MRTVSPTANACLAEEGVADGRFGAVFLLFLLSFFAAFLAFHYLPHFLFYEVVVLFCVYLVHIGLEGVQFFAQTLCLFLLGLAFAYFANGVLYVTVAFLQQFLRLFLCLAQYLLPLAVKFLYFFLILCYGLLQVFFALVHVLPFVLPIAFVAHNVLQIFVALYVVGAYDVACLSYHLVGNARLAGYFYGERRPRLTDGELEQRPHLVAVVEHCAVGYAFMRVGKVLEVLIVGGDYAPCVLLYKLAQHGFCHCSAYLRLGACAEFVNQQQCGVACLPHHVLHVEQV